MCREIAKIQAGALSRRQALDGGMSSSGVASKLRSGRWQPLQCGVYSVFTGMPSRETTLWAAVLLAGPGAALSHQTAGELFKLTDQPSSLVHLTVPRERRVRADASGLVIHRSGRLAQAIHPALLPPRTRIEETVLDLANLAPTSEAAFGVACAACQRRLTTPARIADAMKRRSRQRWRRE